jgi:hypothetical protein
MSSGHTFLTTEQLTELKKKNAVISLIDADIPAYSVAFKCENILSWSLVEKQVDNFMRDKIQKSGGTHVIGFLTNGGKNYRLDDAVTYQYKGNRAGADRPKWYTKIREYLQTAWRCQVMQGIEADDALAIAHKYFRDNGIKSVLCSLDKDLRQSPGWHYNWNRELLDYVDDDKAEGYLWQQVITGDLGTDNIPGLSEAAWKPEPGFKTPVFETYMKTPNEPKMLKSGKPSERTMAHVRLIGWETITDPKQIKPLTDSLYGKERAKDMLNGVAVEDYATVVLNEYVDAYWMDGELKGYEDPSERGIERFNEVFRLVYMLRTVDEIPNDAVIDFTPQDASYQIFNEFEDDEDALADFDDEF